MCLLASRVETKSLNVPLTFPYPIKLHSFNELHFYAHSIEKNLEELELSADSLESPLSN